MHICLQKSPFAEKGTWWPPSGPSAPGVSARWTQPRSPTTCTGPPGSTGPSSGSPAPSSGAAPGSCGQRRTNCTYVHTKWAKRNNRGGGQTKALLLLLLCQEAITWFFLWETVFYVNVLQVMLSVRNAHGVKMGPFRNKFSVLSITREKTLRQFMLKNLLHYYRSTTPP